MSKEYRKCKKKFIYNTVALSDRGSKYSGFQLPWPQLLFNIITIRSHFILFTVTQTVTGKRKDHHLTYQYSHVSLLLMINVSFVYVWKCYATCHFCFLFWIDIFSYIINIQLLCFYWHESKTSRMQSYISSIRMISNICLKVRSVFCFLASSGVCCKFLCMRNLQKCSFAVLFCLYWWSSCKSLPFVPKTSLWKQTCPLIDLLFLFKEVISQWIKFLLILWEKKVSEVQKCYNVTPRQRKN